MRTFGLCCSIALALAVIAPTPPVSAQAGGPGDAPLPAEAKEASLAIEDADLAAAAKALSETTGIRVAVEGEVPERKLTLTVQRIATRRLLGVVAALYGVSWEARGGVVVFLPRPAETVPGTAPGALPPSNQIQAVADELRAMGFAGLGQVRAVGNSEVNRRKDQVCQGLVQLFSPTGVERMLQAGENARQLGVRVRDLPPELQRSLLDWQHAKHLESVTSTLFFGLRPFDPDQYRGATLWLNGSSLVVQGRGMTESYGPVHPAAK